MGQPTGPSIDVGELIVSRSYETGLITRKSVQSLSAIEGSAEQIARGLGDPSARERAFLVSMMPDDSSSIFSKGANASMVAQGHNDIVAELQDLVSNDASDDILLHTRYLNGTILNPYTTLKQIKLMDLATYQEAGGTPLYDQSVITLGTVIAKTAQLANMGVKVRTFTLIISDGADRYSQTATAQSVAWIVGDMLITGNHIVAAMGVNDGVTDFRAIFGQMGIKPGWILTADNARDAIRKAFLEIKDALVLAAGSEDGFTTLALGPGLG